MLLERKVAWTTFTFQSSGGGGFPADSKNLPPPPEDWKVKVVHATFRSSNICWE